MYLTIIAGGERNWTAVVPELHCVVTAPDRDHLLKLAGESIAVAVEDRASAPARIRTLDQVSGAIRADLDGSEEVVFLSPAPMNPVSLEIESAPLRGARFRIRMPAAEKS